MESEALKIILNLKKENVLLKRAMKDFWLMICERKAYRVLQYNDNDANMLYKEIYNLLSSLENHNDT